MSGGCGLGGGGSGGGGGLVGCFLEPGSLEIELLDLVAMPEDADYVADLE